jgi:hypothetical protein
MSIGTLPTRILFPFLTQPGALRFDTNQVAILAPIKCDSISTRSFIRSHHRLIKSPKIIIFCCYEKSVGPFGEGARQVAPKNRHDGAALALSKRARILLAVLAVLALGGGGGFYLFRMRPQGVDTLTL